MAPALAFLAGTLVGALALGDLILDGDRAAMDAPAVAPSAGEPAAGDAAAVHDTESGAAAGLASLAVEAVAEAPESSPGSSPESPPPKSLAAPGAELEERLGSILAAWRVAEARIADLQTRLASVERTLAASRPEDRSADSGMPRSPSTPDERRKALVDAGVDAVLADDILWREARTELDRLALRDQAVREGWIGSDRYREELRALSAEDRTLREEIGDTAWDRYLYLTGEDNRVRVSSVIPGSAAEAGGLQPGDLIESYGGERLYAFSELRDATTAGESGELVAVRVRRGGEVLDAWVARGPLGVRMDMTRVEPRP